MSLVCDVSPSYLVVLHLRLAVLVEVKAMAMTVMAMMAMMAPSSFGASVECVLSVELVG